MSPADVVAPCLVTANAQKPAELVWRDRGSRTFLTGLGAQRGESSLQFRRQVAAPGGGGGAWGCRVWGFSLWAGAGPAGDSRGPTWPPQLRCRGWTSSVGPRPPGREANRAWCGWPGTLPPLRHGPRQAGGQTGRPGPVLTCCACCLCAGVTCCRQARLRGRRGGQGWGREGWTSGRAAGAQCRPARSQLGSGSARQGRGTCTFFLRLPPGPAGCPWDLALAQKWPRGQRGVRVCKGVWVSGSQTLPLHPCCAPAQREGSQDRLPSGLPLPALLTLLIPALSRP